jgi:hypothetical protein
LNIRKSRITSTCLATIASACVAFAASANGVDTYTGGAGLAVVPLDFQPIGARVLGANYAGTPAEPVVNGGPAPMFDPVTFAVIGFMQVDSVDNGDGTYTVTMVAQTPDGSPFVSTGDDLTVETVKGPQTATDFVIDFGNAYQQPGFPVDGANVGGAVGDVFVSVNYFFTRVDGSVNSEIGDTTGPYLTPAGFVFAWGFAIEDALDQIINCGFAATFEAYTDPCSDCVGDLTGDCEVNGADMGILLSNWGACSDCPGDLDGNGTVSGADLGLILSAWGPCP